MGYSHGKNWTNEDTKKDILRIVDTLGLDHFPTHSEMIGFYGNRSLTNRVSKSGGTRHWAKELNLPIKNCESELGNDYELFAIKEVAEHTRLISTQTKPRFPYDLLVDECVKIDVKVSYQFQNNCNAWANTFNLEKKDPTCDIFILYCLDMNGDIDKTLVITAVALIGQSQVGVGRESKWDKYRDCWRYIVEFDVFMNSYNN